MLTSMLYADFRLLYLNVFFFVIAVFLKVLLCASSQMGSIVECWSLRKEGLPVNNIFQHRSPVGKLHKSQFGKEFCYSVDLIQRSDMTGMKARL